MVEILSTGDHAEGPRDLFIKGDDIAYAVCLNSDSQARYQLVALSSYLTNGHHNETDKEYE